jgi:hypothetical protein
VEILLKAGTKRRSYWLSLPPPKFEVDMIIGPRVFESPFTFAL